MLLRFAPDIKDCHKKGHFQRAIEITENVKPTSNAFIKSRLKSVHSMSTSNLQFLPPGTVSSSGNDSKGRNAMQFMLCSNSPALRIMLPSILQHAEDNTRIHSQVSSMCELQFCAALSNINNFADCFVLQEDFIHCLVPDLMQITNCSFYWGKMDRYEAERLLDNKPEGTFLLRDSAQEEFLFSLSFRKYGRSLHARIEQSDHEFRYASYLFGYFRSNFHFKRNIKKKKISRLTIFFCIISIAVLTVMIQMSIHHEQ